MIAIAGKNFLGGDKDPKTFQITLDDARVKAHEEKLSAAKKTESFEKEKRQDLDGAVLWQQSQLIGEAVAARKDTQFVLFGETHFHPQTWDGILGFLRGMKASKNFDKNRKVIVVQERSPNSSEDAHFEKWNSGEYKKKKLQLGNQIAGGAGIDGWEGLMWPTSKEDTQSLIGLYSLPAAMNELTRMCPNVEIYNVDVNQDGVDFEKGIYDASLADRDTAMAIRLKEIADKNPGALIVGWFGLNHTPEYQQDCPDKPRNIGPRGLNLNDPLGEQLSLLYGRTNVNTITLTDDTVGADCVDNQLKQNNGQIDYVFRVAPVDYKKKWKHSWLP